MECLLVVLGSEFTLRHINRNQAKLRDTGLVDEGPIDVDGPVWRRAGRPGPPPLIGESFLPRFISYMTSEVHLRFVLKLYSFENKYGFNENDKVT